MSKDLITKPTVQDTVTLEESEANQYIRLRGAVGSFVTFLQAFRPTAERALFYRAFDPHEIDTPLLVTVRSQAVDFATKLKKEHEIIAGSLLAPTATQTSGAVGANRLRCNDQKKSPATVVTRLRTFLTSIGGEDV